MATECTSVDSDPLSWWKYHEYLYPNLAVLAKRYLAIPATSVPSERVFSTAGDIVTATRSALSTDSVDKLVFLKKNLKVEWRCTQFRYSSLLQNANVKTCYVAICDIPHVHRATWMQKDPHVYCICKISQEVIWQNCTTSIYQIWKFYVFSIYQYMETLCSYCFTSGICSYLSLRFAQ